MIEKATYRIIDANFNRAREALRVMEEYSRFVLNHPDLSARTKEIRHQLSQSIGQLPADKLLTCRNSAGDVGAETRIPSQHKRKTLVDSLTAGCKRLSEALRALTETVQILDPALAQTIEKLRFQAYSLEKDIFIVGIPQQRFAQVRLYVLVSSTDPNQITRLVCQCAAGGADCLQLRLKGLSDKAILRLAKLFVDRCRENNVLSLINDRIDIAILAGADGVHLGEDDLSVQNARQLQSTPLIIGCTTHNLAELHKACQEHPTYVALGPAFATQTKPDLTTSGLTYVKEGLAVLEEQPIGHVIIGGISQENVTQLTDLGVRTIAVCAAVTQAENPEQACQTLKSMMTLA